MLFCIRREAGQIASIQSIHRYLVKSMVGEAVERCYLTEAGLHGDRLYAFESSGAPAGMLRLTGRERRRCSVTSLSFAPTEESRPQNQACPQYYVHKRYALPCQIWFRGIEL
jgi:uncharacterized protein YcbX